MSIHQAVMVNEALGWLDPKPGEIFVDCTIGAGGHSKKILEKVLPGGKVIGIDKDKEILQLAEKELIDYKDNLILRHANFRDLTQVLKELKIDKVDGLLFDLGVSSLQLDNPARGFSFNADAPLDMRMDASGSEKSAYDLVNFLNKDELGSIIFSLGEERYWRRIAQAIADYRKRKRIETTAELSEIILKAMPGGRGWQKIHPATRTFQALRIAVNDELAALEDALKSAVNIPKPGGRICVISFHSLEDRIVKNIFRDLSKNGILKILTKKPVCPSQEEARVNPRSRSAKLRAVLLT